MEESAMQVEPEVPNQSTTSASSSSTVRFEIKKWNAVAMWSWNINADTCAICRNSLNEPSIEYQVRVELSHFLFYLIIFFLG